jgi:porphobilinogen synthase
MNTKSIPTATRLQPLMQHPGIRAWTGTPVLSKQSLMFPIFITDEEFAVEPIESLPGQSRWGPGKVVEAIAPLVQRGLSAVLLFGVPSPDLEKDPHGTLALDPHTPVVRALKLLSSAFPNLVLAVDVCLCAYTSHGHCGSYVPFYFLLSSLI